MAIKKALLFPFVSLVDYAGVREKTLSRYWMMLSIGTLILSGIFSIVIVIGRTPVISQLISDPLWAKRGLVVHVDLALIIWIYAFLCGLFVLIPTAKRSNRLLPLGYTLALAGVGMILSTIFIPSAEPVLSNYIPVLDHPMFIGGLLIFGSGVACTVLNERIIPHSGGIPLFSDTAPESIFPASSVPGFRAAGIILLVSLITFAGSWLATPGHFESLAYYELTIWGGGHLLQFVNVAAMVSVWIILLGKLTGSDPVPYRWSSILFGIFTLPVLAAPLLTLRGTSDTLYHWGFTRYMQWGIFPVVLIFMGIILFSLIRHKRAGKLPPNLLKNPYFGGLLTSIVLTAIGFLLGAFIRGSNTLIPAHYHAAVGGITVAFMAVTYLLMEYHRVSLPTGRIKRWASVQPLLFGLGQATFAAGFGYAGIHGLARKSFGAEQLIESFDVLLGLIFMALGGLLAVTGGLLFLWIVFTSWRSHRSVTSKPKHQLYGN